MSNEVEFVFAFILMALIGIGMTYLFFMIYELLNDSVDVYSLVTSGILDSHERLSEEELRSITQVWNSLVEAGKANTKNEEMKFNLEGTRMSEDFDGNVSMEYAANIKKIGIDASDLHYIFLNIGLNPMLANVLVENDISALEFSLITPDELQEIFVDFELCKIIWSFIQGLNSAFDYEQKIDEN